MTHSHSPRSLRRELALWLVGVLSALLLVDAW